MAVIEIRHRTGRIETRELSKSEPLLVGQLPTSDIQVDADGVAPIHCRISWKKRDFEVSAVSPDGVQFNGRIVRQALLAPGDVIRVGDIDIVLLSDSTRDDYPVTRAAPPVNESRDGDGHPSDSIHLRAITEDSLPVRSFHYSSQLADEAQAAKGVNPPDGPPGGREPRDAANGSGPHDLSRAAQIALDLDELAEDQDRADSLDPPDLRQLTPAARVRATLATKRLRPGERDAARSPLVIGLLVGALALVLSAATLWFILAREKAQKQYDLAQSQLQSGQYPLAIESFELFLREHPRHALAAQARAAIGTAQVEQAIGGGSPAWDKGLEALQKYIDENRADRQFQENDSPVRKFVLQTADKIAFGAVNSARQLYRRELLPVSAEAVKFIELYSPSENRPDERLKELAGAVQAAQAAILQREAFDTAVSKIDEALAGGRSADGLREYRRIGERYGRAAGEYRPLAERLKKACELERTLTARDDTPREASGPEDASGPAGRLTLTRRIRARSDLASVGVAVFATAADSLFGIDSVTGEPNWRRVIGLDGPFVPVPVSAGAPALLVGDGRRRELLLVDQRTGAVRWRLPLSARPSGAPRIHEGQAYVSLENGVLEQIDLQSGRSTARLTFTQRIAGPCAVSLSGDRMYLSGHENVLYVLTRRPLACTQVVWLGHGPEAIEAPLLMMRGLLLVIENDQQSRSRPRLFETTNEALPPVEIRLPESCRIDGHVRDLPALRGKELFVPSSGERVTAFRVSETGDERALSPVATVQVKSAVDSPIFLATGPDGQMWMLSSALRRFELTQDSLLPSKQETAVGLASQPLQSAGDSLYLGRRLEYSPGVLFAEADRQQMILQWQVSLGAAVLECTAPSEQTGTVLCVTSLGDLFQLSPQKIARGGFDTQSLGQVSVPDGLSSALMATQLSDGRLAVYCTGEGPRLWLPGGEGASREQKLPGLLQAAPVRLGGGLLLALPGRLRLVGRPGDGAVEDLPAPIGHDEPPRWVSVAALDETQAVALSEQGRVARVQFGTAPVPHLEEITHWDAGSPVDLGLALDSGRLFLIDSTSRLVMLSAGSLEPVAQVVLEASPGARPRPVGRSVLVELKTGRLVAFDIDAKLAKKWDAALDGGMLTGDPLAAGEELVVALSDGRVLWLDAANGAISGTVDLGQQLSFGPRMWGDSIVVGSLDGTLIVVKRPADGAP